MKKDKNLIDGIELIKGLSNLPKLGPKEGWPIGKYYELTVRYTEDPNMRLDPHCGFVILDLERTVSDEEVAEWMKRIGAESNE
jgi:hypothetical protein